MGKSLVIRALSAGIGIAAFLAGCAADRPELELTDARRSAALLFDAQPGYPTASDVAYRSDWPSTESSYQLGESIFYQERFIDIQHSWPFGRGPHDHTYRRFSTYRTGVGVR